MNITKITGREILDSRGTPTVEAEVWCADVRGRASVPSGASTGTHEAYELRDGAVAFCGEGVTKAVAHIEGELQEALLGVPADDQYRLDEIMIDLDGTENKARLGANAMLAVSLAAAHAAAARRGVTLFQHINDVAQRPEMCLPMPMLNLLNGGKHAPDSADFQEYMVIPTCANTYRDAIRIASEIFMHLRTALHEKGLSTTVGDEGGFAMHVSSNTEMLEVLHKTCVVAGYTPGKDVHFALDVAATELMRGDAYILATEERTLSAKEMIQYLKELTEKYPIISIEDGLGEDDWVSWIALTESLGKLQLVGDDLFVTNKERLLKGIELGAGNAVLIKPNQIGTLTETIRTITCAKEAGWNTIVSHRSGATEDMTIAHIAVGTGAGQIKTGSVSRGERTAKHNELMRIEDMHPGLPFVHPVLPPEVVH